jgi:uncharacterized protein (TIGR03435 family)
VRRIMGAMRQVMRAMRMGWAWMGIAVLAAGVSVRAQDAPASDGITQPKMMAKDANPDWDVVTVKPSDPIHSENTFDVRGRHVIAGNRTVEMMLRMAYGIQPSQILGGPDWIRTEHFDADGFADVEGQVNLKQFQILIRKLLAERFGLVMHVEQRETSVYALTVAKGGSKLTKSAGDPDGLPNDDDRRNGTVRSVQMENATMGDFALDLMFYTDRPVVDRTGLSGRYNLMLKWTFDETQPSADASAPPSIFTAIQEQVGLRLEPVKASVDAFVVDKVKLPEAN